MSFQIISTQYFADLQLTHPIIGDDNMFDPRGALSAIANSQGVRYGEKSVKKAKEEED